MSPLTQLHPHAYRNRARLRRDSRKNLRARSVWRGDSIPLWLELILGPLAWLAWKLGDLFPTEPAHRKFRTCAMPRCKRVYYGSSELCRECRQIVKDKAK